MLRITAGVFNPSYLPPTLAQYFTRFGAPWTTLRETNQRFIAGNRPERLFARLGAL
ncbi:Endoglucanase precursor [Escherichia coli ISC41]|nr:Endoglucanase precursor [Escherichia coli ISC41]